MKRLFIVGCATILAGCPADPATPIDDMGEDMGDDVVEMPSLAIDALAPSEGPTDGGTEVTLTGAGFVEGMTVRFGSTDAVDADVTSETEASVTTPASMAAGAVTVVVETPDGETASLQNGFTYTGGGVVDFCQLQAQSPTAAVTTVPSTTLYAFAFVEGVTQGEGQGAGVEAELGYGTGGDVESFTYAPMDYNVDLDGLEDDDLANDEYGGELAIDDVGTYQYAARFRFDNGAWTYCDLDGSENGISEDQLGVVEVTELGELVDACSLRFPQIVDDALPAQTLTFFGRVTEAGITGNGEANPVLRGQLFFGPQDVDPAADFTAFTEVPARVSRNPSEIGPDEDEYVATFQPGAEGDFSFGFRFSADQGETWSYCGIQDSEMPSGEFTPEKLGALNATMAPDPIDFCHVWQDTLDDSGTLPTVTVEVFEDPVTVGNGGANSDQLEVEAAALDLEINPALADVTWNPMPYKDLRPGEPNNYEYEGTPYTMATKPAAGTYNVVARVRRLGEAPWTYCDIDEAADRFRLSAASRLTIAP